MKIGIISDTHGHIDERILHHLQNCDEIWHGGDIGEEAVLEALEGIAKVRAVYGNIDGGPLRWHQPEHQVFDCEGVKVWMTHIGGYPPKYTAQLKRQLDEIKPGLFICGHSHILKVIPDKERQLLHINPGAAGHKGFHKMRTLVTLEIKGGKMSDLKVIELGKRGAIEIDN